MLLSTTWHFLLIKFLRLTHFRLTDKMIDQLESAIGLSLQISHLFSMSHVMSGQALNDFPFT